MIQFHKLYFQSFNIHMLKSSYVYSFSVHFCSFVLFSNIHYPECQAYKPSQCMCCSFQFPCIYVYKIIEEKSQISWDYREKSQISVTALKGLKSSKIKAPCACVCVCVVSPQIQIAESLFVSPNGHFLCFSPQNSQIAKTPSQNCNCCVCEYFSINNPRNGSFFFLFVVAAANQWG